MKNWEVLIVPAIAVVVWILTSLFRRDDTPQQPPRRADRFGDAPQQRRPMTNLDRTLEEGRRRREAAARRPDPSRAVVLEEVRIPPRRDTARPAPQPAPVILELAEPVAPTSLQVTRAGYTPTQSPSKAPAVKPLPPPGPLVPGPAQTSLQETRSGYTPTPSPSGKSTEKLLAALPAIVQVRQMLRSPQSAAAAFVLREILDVPRCRRPR